MTRDQVKSQNFVGMSESSAFEKEYFSTFLVGWLKMEAQEHHIAGWCTEVIIRPILLPGGNQIKP